MSNPAKGDHKITSWQDDDADAVLSPLFIQLKTGSANSNKTRQITIKPLEYLPKIFSTDPLYLKFLGALADRLERELPVSIDEMGRSKGNGVKKSWYFLRHVGGVPMNPATFVLADNRPKRTEYGLSNEWVDPLHCDLFKAICAVTLSSYANTGLKIAKGTSTGVPYFTTQTLAKRQLALDALVNAPKAALLMQAGNWEEAYLKYKIGGSYISVFRDQYNDGVSKVNGQFVSKDRKVADMLYSRTNGRQGSLFVADKNPQHFTDLPIPNGYFAARRRLALAMPASLGAIIQAYAQAFRTGMYNKYPLIFKHTTRDSLAKKLAMHEEALFTDVSDHDTLWPSSLYVPAMVEVMRELGFSEGFLTLYETSLKLPVYMGAYSYDDSVNHRLIGDWRKPDLSMGMPSGWPGTDLAGTQGMTFVYMLFIAQHVDKRLMNDLQRAYARSPTWRSLAPIVDKWFKWEYDSALLDKVDDAITLARGECSEALVRVHREMASNSEQSWSPYMRISYEEGTAFLGTQAIFAEDNDLSNVLLTGDISSYVKNIFLNEYSIDLGRPRESRSRRYPGLALGSAFDVYGTAPAWKQVNSIIEEVYYDHFGSSFSAMREQWYEDDKQALAAELRAFAASIDSVHLSRQDLDVLADPAKLHYKYTPEDINPVIVEMLSSTIDGPELDGFYSFMIDLEKYNLMRMQ